MIFLIGMPGAGKTYWGKKVADEFGYTFTDLDIYIEKKEKASIATLFEIEGEDGFRDMENRYLAAVIKASAEDTVIACGGGTPCFFNNMDMMLEAGEVIYLQSSIPCLVNNLQHETTKRPLLKNNPDIAATLTAMLAERKEDYELAQHILQTENISLTTFEKILNHV
jgi:shikimate kinase